MVSLATKVAFFTVCDAPLNKISSRKSNILEKVVSAIAIAIFTIFSLGYYIGYAREFYAKQRLANAKQELHTAVDNGDADLIKSLFDKAPELKKTINGEDGHVPCLLHVAIDKGNFDVADLLIQNNANINAFGRYGTPLAVAAKNHDIKSMEWLLERKANPNLDSTTERAIYMALVQKFKDENTRFEMIELLLKYDADPNLQYCAFSVLALTAYSLWKIDSERTKNILKQMIDKGVTLNAEKTFKICEEAQIFIDECIADYSAQPHAK